MAPKTEQNVAGSETVPQTSERKLSVVPMPLVKKVKDQLNADGANVNLKAQDLKTVLEGFVKLIVDSTSKGDAVTLPNNMTFRRVLRNERTHKNPKTKEEITKPAHYVLSMYPKAQLKQNFAQLPVQDSDMDKLKNKKTDQ